MPKHPAPGPPTDAPSPQAAIVTLFRTATRLQQRFAATVEPAGITLQQFNVLRILRGAGTDGLTVTGIGERMIDREPGVTRLIDRLEARGLVTRGRTTTDRRQVIVKITPDGLALTHSLDDSISRLDQAVAGQLTGDERRELIGLLNRLGG